MRWFLISGLLFLSGIYGHCGGNGRPTSVASPRWDPFLDTLQEHTLRYFLETTDSSTGLSPDRWPSSSPSSIAAVGFALTTYPIAVERGLISHEVAAGRVRSALTFLWNLPQNNRSSNTAGYEGFFYHFVSVRDGIRVWQCELSTVDTALLMAGVIFCQTYFDGKSSVENDIRNVADSLYRRVDWLWAMGDAKGIRLGWKPEEGFNKFTWDGYNEAMVLYILALGSPSHPIPPAAWQHWTATYRWAKYFESEFISFGPLFGHQYSHCWVDFRGIQDVYMRGKGIDYAENSRRATFAHREYGRTNPDGWNGYSDHLWGWSACDGPGWVTQEINGAKKTFMGYGARGVSFDWVSDDGTIAPTAVGGSVAFAPEICIPTLKAMRDVYDGRLFGQYGFIDAFNLSFVDAETGRQGWFDHDYLGIDQGPIAIMIENLRNGFVWEIMKKSPYLRDGLRRAGFDGGWLAFR